MSMNNNGLSDVFGSGPNEPMNTTEASQMTQIEDIKRQTMEHTLYAAAQSLAMAKLKVFNSMAKQVNDQQ